MQFFPSKEIWGTHDPLRTCFFAWEAIWGKILTVNTLMKSGWQMVNKCNLCKDSEESATHILIHYAKTRELQTFLLVLFQLVWEFLDSMRNLLLQWKVEGFQKKERIVWHLAPICLFWCIWKEHNQRTFKNEELSNQRLKNLFIRTLFEWSRDSLELKLPSMLNLPRYSLLWLALLCFVCQCIPSLFEVCLELFPCILPIYTRRAPSLLAVLNT